MCCILIQLKYSEKLKHLRRKKKRERTNKKITNIYLKSGKPPKIPQGWSYGSIQMKISALSCWQCSGSEKCKFFVRKWKLKSDLLFVAYSLEKQAASWLWFNPFRGLYLAPSKIPSCDGGGPSLGRTFINNYRTFVEHCWTFNCRKNSKFMVKGHEPKLYGAPMICWSFL